MKIEDTIWLLAHSTNPEDRREWAVLYWKSQGLKHEEIAEKWRYSIQWVQRYMTRAYKRFEVPPQLNKYEKILYLEQNVFPLMRKFIEYEPDIVKELPAPPTEAAPIEEPEETGAPGGDYGSVTPPKKMNSKEPPIIDINFPPRLPPPPPSWRILRRVFFAVVSLMIVSGVGYYAYNLGRGNTPPPQIVVITATFPPATDTLVPSATFSIPTDTPIPTSTATQIPTNTPVPTEFIPPADGILFQDDFESGDISAWTQVNGKWLVSNGQLTVLGDENDSYKWIALKRPEWKNYILSLNVYQPHQGAASQSDVLVTVRNNGSQLKYLGIPVDHFGNVYWAFIGSDLFDNDVIAGNKFEFGFESGSNMELEMQGDTYILRVNGREFQRITMSGYDSGGISLGSECGSSDDCASFDNVKVKYLP